MELPLLVDNKKKKEIRKISFKKKREKNPRINSQCRRQTNKRRNAKLATKERKNDLRRNSSIQKRLPIKAV